MRRDVAPNIAPRASAPASAFRKPGRGIFRAGSQRGLFAKSGSGSSLKPDKKHSSRKRMSSPGLSSPMDSQSSNGKSFLIGDDPSDPDAIASDGVETSRDRSRSQPSASARSPSSKSSASATGSRLRNGGSGRGMNHLEPPSKIRALRGGGNESSTSNGGSEKSDGSESNPRARLKREGSQELLDFSDALDIRVRAAFVTLLFCFKPLLESCAV